MVDLNANNLRSPLSVNDLISQMSLLIGAKYAISIYSSCDFHQFFQLRERLRGKIVSPYFNPKCVRNIDETGFWLWGEKDGEIVYLEAFCTVEVRGDFKTWLEKWLWHCHGPAGENVSVQSVTNTAPDEFFLGLLRGMVGYGGEFWLAPSIRSGRESKMVEDISLLAMFLCADWFKVDFVFGLSNNERAKSGLLYRMQFCHFFERFLVWGERPHCVEEDEETLLVATRERLVSSVHNRVMQEFPSRKIRVKS